MKFDSGEFSQDNTYRYKVSIDRYDEVIKKGFVEFCLIFPSNTSYFLFCFDNFDPLND